MNGLKAVGVLKAAFRVSDLDAETIRLYAAKLDEIDATLLDDVIHKAIVQCKFFPSIAELFEIASDRQPSGHLPPEEAWALVADLEEGDSVVWTDEIAEAYGVAESVLPDRVGARMAFLSAYRRLVAQGEPPVWWASLGYDEPGRAAVILDAIARKRLPDTAAQRMLAPHYWPSDSKMLSSGDS